MSSQDEELSTQAHRILRLYEMFFSLMFRFMEEYEVKDLGQLMILTTIAIANANKIDPDIEIISEETDIPYSTVRRKVDKMCEDGMICVRRSNSKLLFSISPEMRFAHPEQEEENSNKIFQKDVLDIIVKSLTAIILEKNK
jgi:DNA-binding MarR family transcriptional regulator